MQQHGNNLKNKLQYFMFVKAPKMSRQNQRLRCSQSILDESELSVSRYVRPYPVKKCCQFPFDTELGVPHR